MPRFRETRRGVGSGGIAGGIAVGIVGAEAGAVVAGTEAGATVASYKPSKGETIQAKETVDRETSDVKEKIKSNVTKLLEKQNESNFEFDKFRTDLKNIFIENGQGDVYDVLDTALDIFDEDDKKNLTFVKEFINQWIKDKLKKVIVTGSAAKVKAIAKAGVKAVAAGETEKLKKKVENFEKQNEHGQENSSIGEILKTIKNIDYKDYRDLGTKILEISHKANINLTDTKVKSYIHNAYNDIIKLKGNDILNNKAGKCIVMTYALSCGINDIDSDYKLNKFIRTVQNDGVEQDEYAKIYREMVDELEEYYDNCLEEIAIQSLIARYEAANLAAQGRSFYESDKIQLFRSSDGQQQSGAEVASNITDIDNKLNHYNCKSNRTEHEDAALRYTAFDITFKNTFNLTNPIIEKLAAQQIDLRADLLNYRIYVPDKEDSYCDEEARNRYVDEKLKPLGLTQGEIDELWKAIAGLPAEVEKNYITLSGNFDADQDSFEKIAKIYALGEVIDCINSLFKNNEVLSDNQKLGGLMGLTLDENEPAEISGDCLILKGTVNGTKTKIKYDLRTGKLYMNSFSQQEYNPPKISIGNDEPNTEIGNLGNFDDLLKGYQSTAFSQVDDDIDYTQTSSENDVVDDENNVIDNENLDEPVNEDSNQNKLENLVKNELFGRLSEIGQIVKENAGELNSENILIDSFLKTFNILQDNSNLNSSLDIEFMGGSTIFTLLKAIKDTDNEEELASFSAAMETLMSFCELKWGKNNLNSRGHEFSSLTIFDIDENNATPEIISLQSANQKFFATNDGENGKLKSCESHFNSSVQLSFADIIFQKCRKGSPGNREISAERTNTFVNDVISGANKANNDKSSLLAIETKLADDATWEC